MVKILKKKGGSKLPVLRIVQALVVGVLCLYVAFVLNGPAATCNKLLNNPKNTESTNDNAMVRVKNEGEAPTIGYAVSITGCGSDPLEEGAAVLKHSIHLASVHGNMGGRYDYKIYAIYHPDAAKCASTLAPLGYEMLERQTPVKVSDIEGEFLRSKIENNGCCGEKELIKLEAYTLTDHGELNLGGSLLYGYPVFKMSVLIKSQHFSILFFLSASFV
jgi:hypothetical protein